MSTTHEAPMSPADATTIIAALILSALSVSPAIAAMWTPADTTAMAAARVELAMMDEGQP